MSKSIAVGGLSQFSPSQILTGTNVDWSQANIFRANSSNGTNFSFTNAKEGQTITIKIVNNGLVDYTPVWPVGVTISDSAIEPSKTRIYNFIKVNGTIYGNYLDIEV